MVGEPRVLMIGPHPSRSFGGMSTVIQEILASEEIASSYSIDMWPSFIDGSLIRRAAYSLSKELLFRMSKKQYEVYHIHVACDTSTWRKRRYIEMLGAQACHVVMHVHGSHYDSFFDSCTERQQAMIRDLYSKVGSVIVLSEEWHDFFVENRICDPSKLTVIHNAVEIPASNRTDYENERVLFLGRLSDRKSPDTLLEAIPLILKEHPRAEFFFAGDGDVDCYRRMAESIGVADNCRFEGWVSGEAREDLFSRCSLFCLPSKSEGMPMSVLESMARGLAVIATPVGGVPQVIEKGSNGFLVDVGDSVSLAKLIIRLLDSPQLKRLIGEAGRNTAKEMFGMRAFEKKIMEVYERVC